MKLEEFGDYDERVFHVKINMLIGPTRNDNLETQNGNPVFELQVSAQILETGDYIDFTLDRSDS